MGFIGKVRDWYGRHKVISAFATAAGGVAMLNAADAAAEIFFNAPVAAAAVAQTGEQSPLTVSGDVRTCGRYVEDTAGFDKRTVDARARLNLDYEPADNMKFGVRGVAEYSTHPPFDHRFLDDHYEFFIDRAFADMEINDQIRLLLGAFGNTLTGWYDKDVPLVGGQLTYSGEGASILDRTKARLVYHGGQPWLDESDSKLWAIELEGEKELTDAWKVTGNLNYVNWFGLDDGFVRTNKMEGSGYANDFWIVNAGARFVNSGVDVPVFGSPLSLYVTGMHNLGASDDNSGYIIGIGLGGLKKPGDSCMSLEYKRVEADAAHAGYAPKVTPFTNFTAPVLSVGHRLGENTSLLWGFALPVGIDDNRGAWEYGVLSLQYEF